METRCEKYCFFLRESDIKPADHYLMERTGPNFRHSRGSGHRRGTGRIKKSVGERAPHKSTPLRAAPVKALSLIHI